jgi:CspA family cold shock protein
MRTAAHRLLFGANLDDIMQKGTVKWFNDQKGFGFIESELKDYFVHFKEIRNDGFKTLKPGQTVTFNPEKSAKGLIAKNVAVEVRE